MADVVAARITIPVTTDAGKASIDLKRVSSTIDELGLSAKKTSISVQGMADGMKFLKSAIVAGAALVGLGKLKSIMMESIDAAANLQAQTKKFNAVFGSMAESAMETAQTISKSYNLQDDEVMKYMSSLQNLNTSMGLNKKLSAEMSGEIVRLAADVAKFTGSDIEAVLGAMQSGLTGATRGLKEYGIVINDDMIYQEALRMGIVRNKSELDNAAKSQAVYSLMIKQTANAQGAAFNSAESYKGSVKALANAQNDMSEAMGANLIPGMTKMNKALADMIAEDMPIRRMFEGFADVAGKALSYIADKVYALSISLAQMQVWLYEADTGVKSYSEALKKQDQILEGSKIASSDYKDSLVSLIKAYGSLEKAQNAIQKSETLNSDEIVVNGEVLKKGTAEWKTYVNQLYGAGTAYKALSSTQSGVAKFTADINKALQVAFQGGNFGAGMKAMDEQMKYALANAKANKLSQLDVENSFGRQRLDMIKSFLTQQSGSELENLDVRKQQLQKAYDGILATQQLSQQERLAAKEVFDAQMAGLDDIYYANLAAKVQNFATGATMVMDIVKGIMSAMNAADQQDIDNMQEKIRLEDQAASRKEAIVGKTQAEIATMNERWAKEDEIAQKQKELRKKQAIQTKAIGIFQAIIGTAMAITGFLAQSLTLGPAAWAFAIMAGIKGAAEIAVIAAQPIPSAAFGGQFMVPPGNEADSGLLKVSSGEDVSVTPARNSGSGPQRVTVTIGARDFEGYFAEMTDKVLNSGKVQIRRSGVVKFA